MITLIKLTNGVELIGDIIEQNKEFFTVKDPLQINYRQRMDMGPPAVFLHRFNPFSLTTEHMLRDEHVLSYSKPLPGLVKYYSATLDTIKDSIDAQINNELSSAAESFMGEEDEIREAMMEKAQHKPTLN